MKLYLFIPLLFVFEVQAQSDFSFEFKQYTQFDGLSSNVTYTAIEDKKGCYWIGTRKGITRFDGQHLKPFNDEHGIALDEVQHLFLDNDVLWCFQEIEQHYLIFLFHTLEERLLSFEEYLGQSLPFKQYEITDIQLLSKGFIVHTQSDKQQKVYSYIPEKGCTELKFMTDENSDKNSDKKQIISITNDNEYWIANTKKTFELYKVNPFGEILESVNPNFFETTITTEIIEIQEEYVDEQTAIFFKYKTEKEVGLFSINQQGQPKSEGKTNFSFNLVDFGYYPRQQLFLYYPGMDVRLISLHGDIVKQIPFSFKKPLLNCLISDYSTLFLAADGFFLFEFTDEIISPKFKTFLKKEKVSTRGIITVNERLYVNGNQLYTTDVSLNSDYETGLSNLHSFCVVADKLDNLWIGRRDELVYYNTKTEKSKTYKIKGNPWKLYEDEQGQIWYNDYQGLACLNPQTGAISTLKKNGLEQLNDLRIYHFHKKEDGLFFLLTDLGILEFSFQKGLINRYWRKGKGKYYLPARNFKHLYYEKDAAIYWLASNNGLMRWQPKTGTYEIFAFNNFTANTIHAVYPDANNHLWLSTENGIIQFDKSTYKFRTYLEKDGISHHEFNRISHFQDEDGRIYFGGLQGVTIFHPRDFKTALKNIQNPKVTIVELLQYLGSENKLTNTTADFYKNQRIIVQPNDGYFTLKMGVANYSLLSEVQLQYKFKKSDNWTTALENEITIQQLPYGNYTLQIKAIGESGQFDKTYLEIPIIIIKPLYLKWWFWAIIVFLLAGLIIGITKWRTQEINRRNKELEQEVIKRTAKIESDKQIIEEQAERLLELDKTKSKFFANVSHELRTPITLIKGPIQSILNSNELGQKNLNLLTKAKRNTANLLRLVNEILDLTKMEANKLTLDENKVAFYPFLRRIVSNFQSFADIENIKFIFIYKNLDKSLQLNLDEHKLEKVLNNILSNAFKFTPQNGQIEVVVEESDALKASNSFNENGILITIKDNGRGIAPEDIPYIFNRYYQSKNNTKAEGGLGIGLALSMEFVHLMNGKMWVKSQIDGKNKGSTFFLQIPKKEVISMLSTEDELDVYRGKHSNTQTIEHSNTQTIEPSKEHTILLVEDNLDLREYVSFLLSPFYNVVTAKNGKEGIEWLTANGRRQTENNLPSAVISDVMMPIMDGFEFLEIVKSKAKWRNIPFIMLTARVELKDKLKALRIGVDDYLIKPFDEVELLTRIENLLTNYEERQQFSLTEKNEPLTDENIVLDEAQLWLIDIEKMIIKEINHPQFTIDYLVELIGINRNTFYSKIKTLTGLSANQYIKTVRLKVAKDLLETSDFTIKEIAQKVGFQTPAYFSRQFKKEYGKLPSEYLK